MTKSRTQQALELVQAGMIPRRAAQLVGINSITVYKALKQKAKLDARPKCPTCGQPIKPTQA